MARHSSDNSGCGCLILVVLAIAFVVNKSTESDTKSTVTSTTAQQTRPSSYYDTSSNVVDVEEDELSEEDKKYLGNSLYTGAAPYTKFYGKNYRCPHSQCSGIKVTAPKESDIVVIIKRDNSNGKVVSHGYVKAGGTCFFPIPDGTYQTFFYYGEGWNPNKVMTGGIKGGFVKDEIFTKDNPQDIYSGILTYVLQLQRDGNFQTKGSCKGEVF